MSNDHHQTQCVDVSRVRLAPSQVRDVPLIVLDLQEISLLFVYLVLSCLISSFSEWRSDCTPGLLQYTLTDHLVQHYLAILRLVVLIKVFTYIL